MRRYAATFVVAICVLIVILFNISSERENMESLFSLVVGTPDETRPLQNKLAADSTKKNNLATAPLSNMNIVSSATISSETEDYYYADMYMPEPTIKNQILFASIGPQTPIAKEKRGTKTYEVKTGDTASSIAASFGISTSTILSANNLSENSLLKPGDKLSVLPVTGATYKAKKGDSLEAIAKKYNVDPQKVIAFNDLSADGNLKEGQTLILPDGYLSPTPTTTPPAGSQLATVPGQTTPSAISSSPIHLSGGGTGHRFPYGYCTWYVSQRRYVPWGGNAISWLANAKAYGKPTGRAPRPGAIMVSTESRWGHVALVESVKGSTFTISEMNYRGFGKKSTRTLSVKSGVIRGFIY